MKYKDPVLVMQWTLFRARLRQRRVDLGLTQAELAKLMGRSHDYVHQLESNNKTIPNLTTMWIWTEALGGTFALSFPEDQDERQQSQAPMDGMAAVHPEDRQSIDEPSAGLQPPGDDHVVLGSALRPARTDGLRSGAVYATDLGEVVTCPSCERQVNVTILGLIRPHRLVEGPNGVAVSFRASPTGWCAGGGLPTEGLS